ncbi:uncharacterized protein LOC110019353 [Phalaenopsis equestris]|uniref:uncharacterized protein LOC110019353 n=1 Tax=Phalaenopsis equestris TaxID=78828 RepID=UPI0009E4B2FF|nr:uncharacterized protein LOC110019353 [Phalaenopsis equestris]
MASSLRSTAQLISYELILSSAILLVILLTGSVAETNRAPFDLAEAESELGNRNAALNGAMFTILLALVFTAFQGVEYSVSSFTLSDGAYGSCFYFGTGFHGIHVIIVAVAAGLEIPEDLPGIEPLSI